jgi:hypothetical protein
VDVTQGPGAWTFTVSSVALALLAQKNPKLCKTIHVNNVPRIHLDPAAFDDCWIVCRYAYH